MPARLASEDETSIESGSVFLREGRAQSSDQVAVAMVNLEFSMQDGPILAFANAVSQAHLKMRFQIRAALGVSDVFD